METRKLVVKISYVLIALLVVALIALSLYQQHLIRQMTGVQEAATSTEAEPNADAGAQIKNESKTKSKTAAPAFSNDGTPLANEVDGLRYQLDAAEEELDMAREDLSTELDRQAEQARNQLALTKKMLQDPAMKKMIRTTMKSTLDTIYGSLFSMLELSDEKLEEFKELLTDQQMWAVEIAQQVLGQAPSEEEQAEMKQRLENQTSEYDDQLQELLGSVDFETYDAYRERIMERQYTTSFFESLGPNEALTEAQQQEVIDAMYQARKEVEADYGIDSQDMQTAFDETEMESRLERMSRTFERYADSVRGTLTEIQMQQFQSQLKQQQEMMEMQIQMANRLYGGAASD